MKNNLNIKNLLLLSLSFLALIPINAQILDDNLQYLIDKAIEKSSKVKINEFSREQVAIDQKTAKFTYLPKFNLKASYTRLDDEIAFPDDMEKLLQGTEALLIKEAIGIPFNTALPDGIPLNDIPVILDKDLFKANINMEWVLFSGLKVRNAVKATEHKMNALEYSGEIEKDNIVVKISENYDQLALVIASEDVLKSTETYLTEQERFVNTAIKNGLATPIERQKINIAKHQLAMKKNDVENNKTLLLEVLHQLTGIDVASIQLMVSSITPIASNQEGEAQKRNEILALEEAITATKFQEKMEKSSFIPKIAASGKYEILQQDLSLLDPTWYIGVGMQWDIFDGNVARNNAKKIAAERQKYEAQLTDAEELIDLSIIKANIDLNNANQKISLTEEEVSLAQQMYQITLKQLSNGLIEIAEVLDAVKELEKAKFNNKNAIYEQRRASINLMIAKGTI